MRRISPRYLLLLLAVWFIGLACHRAYRRAAHHRPHCHGGGRRQGNGRAGPGPVDPGGGDPGAPAVAAAQENSRRADGLLRP